MDRKELTPDEIKAAKLADQQKIMASMPPIGGFTTFYYAKEAGMFAGHKICPKGLSFVGLEPELERLVTLGFLTKKVAGLAPAVDKVVKGPDVYADPTETTSNAMKGTSGVNSSSLSNTLSVEPEPEMSPEEAAAEAEAEKKLQEMLNAPKV